MRVFLRGQREMAEQIGGIARLLERTQHQVGKDALFGFAGNFFRQPLIMLRANVHFVRGGQRDAHGPHAAPGRCSSRARACGRHHVPCFTANAALGEIVHAQRIAESLREFLEFQHVLRIGLFVHAMQRGDAALFEISRDGFIRREHEFFDQAVRDIALAADDAQHAPGFVEFDDAFGQIEIDRAALAAPAIQQQREILHAREIFHERRVARRSFPDRLRALCSRWCRSCARRSESRRGRNRRRRILPFASISMIALITRRSTCGFSEQMPFESSSGSIGHGAIREIDGSAAQPRFAIERRIARDVVRHVRDVHLQLEVAVRRAGGRKRRRQNRARFRRRW